MSVAILFRNIISYNNLLNSLLIDLIGDTCLLTPHFICANLVIVDCVLMFQMAVGKGIQIMSVEWVEKCWELRDDPVTSATDEHLVMCSNCIVIFQFI